jgi:hypothetical protein
MRPDASLLFSNPAVLADLPRGSLFVSTASWLDEFNFTAASLASPIRPAGLMLSLGTRALYSGGLQGYDQSGQIVEVENFHNMALTAGLSRRFDRLGLSVGGDVTYLREHLPNADGSGFAYSLGAGYQFGSNRLTASAENVGGKISFPSGDYPIRNRLVLGYGRVVMVGRSTLDIGAEVSASSSQYERFRVGGTYAVNRYLLLSGGLDHAANSANQPAVPFSAGVGMRFDRFAFDYAYTPQEYFSSTHTVSFALALGEPRSPSGAAPQPNPPAPPKTGQPISDRAGASSLASPKDRSMNPKPTGAAESGFAVVAGRHARMESAAAEVRALELLKIPSVIQTTSGRRYRVVIARFNTLAEAQRSVQSFEKRGHRFTVVSESE